MISQMLLENEKIVLSIIEEYLEKNRYFKSKEIVPYINSRLAKSSININEEGIKAILNSLVKKNLIVEGSKLIREDVLLNSNRKDILDYIKKNQGINFNKIVNGLNLSIPVVEWHLNILLLFNFIRKVKIDNLDAYFDLHIKPEDEKVIHLLTREKCKKIIEYLKINGEGVTKNQLHEMTKLHPNTITKYVDKLDEFGLLKSEVSSNKILYYLNMDYFKELNNILNR